MKVQVLFIANCPNHAPTVARIRAVLHARGAADSVEEIEIRSDEDAKSWSFLGSPSVRINGLDIEPEARQVRHFGLGCRSYAENGRREGLPSEDLIERAIQENGTVSLSKPENRNASEAKRVESNVLVAGGLAAVLASTCCLGPLILVALGFSGAWIGDLAALEPYRPWFIAAALLALCFAGWRIFRPANSCQSGEVCALPTARRAYKVLFGIVAALVVVALALPYVARFFY